MLKLHEQKGLNKVFFMKYPKIENSNNSHIIFPNNV